MIILFFPPEPSFFLLNGIQKNSALTIIKIGLMEQSGSKNTELIPWSEIKSSQLSENRYFRKLKLEIEAQDETRRKEMMKMYTQQIL